MYVVFIRYNAPKAGYYAIYTTGTTDTVGKVYEEQNVLLWTTDYCQSDVNVSMYDIYSKYDSQIIKGVAYEKGHWE